MLERRASQENSVRPKVPPAPLAAAVSAASAEIPAAPQPQMGIPVALALPPVRKAIPVAPLFPLGSAAQQPPAPQRATPPSKRPSNEELFAELKQTAEAKAAARVAAAVPPHNGVHLDAPVTPEKPPSSRRNTPNSWGSSGGKPRPPGRPRNRDSISQEAKSYIWAARKGLNRKSPERKKDPSN